MFELPLVVLASSGAVRCRAAAQAQAIASSVDGDSRPAANVVIPPPGTRLSVSRLIRLAPDTRNYLEGGQMASNVRRWSIPGAPQTVQMSDGEANFRDPSTTRPATQRWLRRRSAFRLISRVRYYLAG